MSMSIKWVKIGAFLCRKTRIFDCYPSTKTLLFTQSSLHKCWIARSYSIVQTVIRRYKHKMSS